MQRPVLTALLLVGGLALAASAHPEGAIPELSHGRQLRVLPFFGKGNKPDLPQLFGKGKGYTPPAVTMVPQETTEYEQVRAARPAPACPDRTE